MVDQILKWVTPALEHFRVAGYWVALLAAMAETILGVGLLLPGSSIILLLGALAAHGALDLGDLLWFAFMGAVLGDNINYFLGRKYGAHWVEGGFWIIRPGHFEKARTFFDRHGAVSVLWGRLIPSVKEVVPFIAGLMGMRRSVFFLWNVIGAGLWSLEWVLAGYFFAQSIELAKSWLSRLGFAVALAAGLFLLLALARRAVVSQGRVVLEIVQSVARSVGKAVAENPEVQKLVGRHERFFSFLRRRLAREHFTGLPLTLLGAAFIYLLALFGGVVEDILTGDPIVAADMHISSLVAAFRTPTLVNFFLWVTMLGKSQVVLVFALTFLAILYLLKEQPLILPFVTVLAGSTAFTWLGKVAFHRPRPDLAVYTEHSLSFPSGHSVISVAFYGFVVFLLVSRTQVWKRKVNYIFAGGLVAIMIGFSRIYLGVHYMSDVWSGYLLGTLWLVVGITLAQYRRTALPSVPEQLPSSRRIAVSALLVAAVIFYGGFTSQNLPTVMLPDLQGSSVRTVSVPGGIFSDERTKFTESLTGNKQQPVNVILVAADDRALVHDIGLAGWLPTDSLSPSSMIRVIGTLAGGKEYASAPVTPSFISVKVNDMSFRHPAAPDAKGVAHVLRLWKTAIRWEGGKYIYVGQVSRGRSLEHVSTHRINLEVDGEREFLVRSLTTAHIPMKHRDIDLVEPTTGKNALGDLFVTDGRAVLVVLEGAASQPGAGREDTVHDAGIPGAGGN